MELNKKTEDALRWIIGILDDKNIPYQICGGFAAKMYGSTRTLNDIDIDIPEKNFADIMYEVKEYIIFGPEYFNDGKWDMYLMTLNYKGQEIDVGGAFDIKVSNKERTDWVSIPADFSTVQHFKIANLDINVMSPEKLIGYKKFLDGEHQIVDIDAVQNYINGRTNTKNI